MLRLVTPAQTQESAAPEIKGARSVAELCAQGFVREATPALAEVERQHPALVTPALLDLIDADDANDPIAKQFIPSVNELNVTARDLPDPIGDQKNNVIPGIIHRYPDRLLLNVSYACPATCRFCFRRGRVGDKGMLSETDQARALDYIRAHTEIWEVILSGGEPLMLSPRRLRAILMELRAIPHVRAIRIHTRAPITIPEKITPELVQLLAAGPRPVNIMIHCNHPRELGPSARAAIARLADAGIPLFSQSVLLRGVNDDVETLTGLMRAFVEDRIKPHYLHHPDLVPGTAHFRVPLARGIDLMRSLQGRLSGLCQPTYILDIPGGAGKVPILSDRVQKTDSGWRIENYSGAFFDYADK